MTTIQLVDTTRSSAAAPADPSADIVAQVRQLATNETSRHSVLRQLLPLLADRFGSLYGIASCEFKSQPITIRYESQPGESASWSSKCNGLILEARYRQQASAKRIASSDGTTQRIALTAPLTISGQGTIGAVVLISSIQDRITIDAQLVALQSLLQIIATAWSSGTDASPSSQPASETNDHNSLQKVAKYETFPEFAYAFTNSLKVRLGCEQVAFAWVQRKRPKLICISGFDRIQRSTPGIELIEQAMSEAMDAAHPVTSRSGSSAAPGAEPDYLLHRKWREQSGATLTATIPLKDGDQTVGLLSIRDRREQPLNQAQLAKADEIIRAMVPGMRLLRRADNSLIGHMTTSAKTKLHASRLLTGRYRFSLAIVVATAIVLFGFGKFPHTVVAPCEFAPSDHIALTTPTNAKLVECHVAAGDIVRQGDLLATMDTEELIAERDSMEYALRSLRVKQYQAIEAADIGEAARLEAEAKSIQAQLDTNQWMINHAEIRAPIDGVVLANLATPLVGSILTTGQPLIELVPLGRFQVQIEVNANNIEEVQPGQLAEIVSRSHPDTRLDCRIDSVEYLVGDQKTGQRVRVHATLQEPAPHWVRVGTPGLASVQIGDRPGWWIALHHTIDRLRLQAWRLSS